MFKDQDQFTNSLFGSYAYDPIIRRNQDHFLVKINKLINWSFVEDEVAGYYSNQGQKAIHPLRMFKLLIIQTCMACLIGIRCPIPTATSFLGILLD